jgi:hypothetical protein
MATLIGGLDIGGAHLKAAQVTADGRVVAARQVPCALWQGLDRLERALEELAPAPGWSGRLAVTMTGELVDFFPERSVGVVRLLALLAGSWPQAELAVWAGGRGFVPLSATEGLAGEIASANWLASAALVARQVENGLFVDVGSTTTDVVAVAGGKVRAAGATDRERLASGELVYTGLTRTPVMALEGEARFTGWPADAAGQGLRPYAVKRAQDGRLTALPHLGVGRLCRLRWRQACLLGEAQIHVAGAVGLEQRRVARQRGGDAHLLRAEVDVGQRHAGLRPDQRAQPGRRAEDEPAVARLVAARASAERRQQAAVAPV